MGARTAAVAVTAIGLVAAGCGDSRVAPRAAGDGASTAPSAPSAPSIEETHRPADPAAVRVIRGWTDAQRSSDVDRATSYFTVPAVVQNGTAPQELPTRAAVHDFNARLPCGAVLVRTSAATQPGFTVAAFRLVQRPGQSCDGTGRPARTAFEIRGGKIQAWLRIPDEAPSGPQPPPTTSPGQGAQAA